MSPPRLVDGPRRGASREISGMARLSRRVLCGGGTGSERGATNPLGSVRVYGARSCVRIMATPDPVDPATLEIKTRSIEQTLLPLVKQVRQLIGKRRKGTLVCSNHFVSFFFFSFI